MNERTHVSLNQSGMLSCVVCKFASSLLLFPRHRCNRRKGFKALKDIINLLRYFNGTVKLPRFRQMPLQSRQAL